MNILAALSLFLTLLCAALPGRAQSAVSVTGATINEKIVRTTIIVDTAGSPGTSRTLQEGFTKAHESLTAGTPTRIIIRPGVYRESVTQRDWNAGRARETLLVVEGTPGKTILTGADVFPLKEWRRDGDLLIHDWPHAFGNFAPFWGPKGLIAHRSELAFVNGIALRPQPLEEYKISGMGEWAGKVVYEYRGTRDPAKTFKPGEFGVAERPENGGKIYVRLPAGAKPTENGIEVSVRRKFIDFGRKRNLVLRGLDIVRWANPQPGAYADTPIDFRADGANVAGNIIIEKCRFLWNSGTALSLTGRNWTIRDSVFNYNGMSGISTTGICTNILMEGCETSFNAWRAWRGGEADWNFGGVKMHEADGSRVTRHLALGNCSPGLWWDVYCGMTEVSDSVTLANVSSNLKWELSVGPFVGRRLVIGGAKIADDYVSNNVGDSRLENSILYHNGTNAKDDKRAVAILISYPREDPHGQRQKIVRGVYGIKSCLIVAGSKTPLLLRGESWGDDNSWFFRADLQNNVYYAIGRDPKFLLHLVPGDIFTVGFSDFTEKATDRGGRLLDPKLRDPQNFDFRFAPDSPLKAEANRYPQYVLPVARRRELRVFWDWLETSPDGPGLPPVTP